MTQAGSNPARVCFNIVFGLKVFMDAHQPVTLKEGDRYPLGPPRMFPSSSEVEQLAVNQLVGGSIPSWGAKF